VAADKDQKEFSAEYAERVVKAVIPSGWKSLNVNSGSGDPKMLGYLHGTFGDVQGFVHIKGYDKAPKSIEELVKKVPDSPLIFPEGVDMVRKWTVVDGDGTQIQLVKERFNDPNDERGSGYWLRYTRFEKIGEKACVLVLYLSLKEHPGSYAKFMDSKDVKSHLAIPDSFKVEKR
jgi:hypothetical protein